VIFGGNHRQKILSSNKVKVKNLDYSTISHGLLGIVFKLPSYLKKIKSLNISGDLVGSEFLTLLPRSIVKLSWAQCEVLPDQKLRIWALRGLFPRKFFRKYFRLFHVRAAPGGLD
jgi:hypothetical protein